MLISFNIVRAKSRRPTCGLVLALGLLCFFNRALAGEAPDVNQRARITAAVVTELSKTDEMPSERALVSIKSWTNWVDNFERRTFILPITVRYKGLANKYCRVAISEAPNFDLKVVPVPTSALYDSCLALSPFYVVRESDSGTPIVVHGVLLKSNRNGAVVREVVVYIADPKSDSGFCYSGTGSAQLNEADLRSKAAVQRSLAISKKRLGPRGFVCGA